MKKTLIYLMLAAGFVTLLSFTLLPETKQSDNQITKHETDRTNSDGYHETNNAKW